MKRFKKILAVVYAADPQALPRATELARINGAQLTLVDTVREFSWPFRLVTPNHAELIQRLVDEKQAQLDALCAPLRDEGLNVSNRVLVGRSSTVIIREMLESGHDLVIKAARGARDAFFGTTAVQLLRQCPCPVWIVQRGVDQPYQRILAAVDASSEDADHTTLNGQILQLALAMRDREQARLDVVQAWSVFGESALQHHMMDSEFQQMVEASRDKVEGCFQRLIKMHDLDLDANHIHLLHGDPREVIPRYARDEQVSLIVMGTVARGGLSGLLMGNTAEAILSRVRCGVLAVKPPGFVSPVSQTTSS